jgi:dTDP-glucose 4,6-dehydratase
MSKTLLLIGGTGFFGNSILKYFYHYSDSLKNKFSKIIILSRGKTQIKFNKNLKKFFKLVKINSNIHNIKNLPLADYIIYAAILGNYKKDHEAIKNYLNLAKKYHLNSKILYISSGAVYGKQLQSTKGFKENYLQFNNKIYFEKSYKKEYSKIKLKNEKLFQQFGKKGAKVSIARCFSFVGKHLPLNEHYAIGNIINSILKNKTISIKANYQIIRSYMYSDDLVKWLLRILENSNHDCPIYNVGSDNAIELHSLATFLGKKYRLNLNFQKRMSKKIIDKYIPSIKKAKKNLNLINSHSSLGAVLKTIRLIKKDKNHNAFKLFN